VFAPEEVPAALEGGADIIDVKDPSAGALGAASPDVLRAVAGLVAGRAPVSAALGDGPHLEDTLALAVAEAVAAGAQYVKIGLLGSCSHASAVGVLSGIRRAAGAAQVVGVAFADRVGGLPASDLPRAAHEAGIQVAMIDTFAKDGVTSLDRLGEEKLGAFVAEAQALGLDVAIAGSLGASDVARARELGADIVGVRGAACAGGRLGRVSAERVRGLAEACAARRTLSKVG